MKALCIGTALALLFPCAHAATDEDAVPAAPVAVPEAASQRKPVIPAIDIRAEVVSSPKRADFAREQASRDARQLADWIVDAGDNRNLPFVIVDKANARMFVFDAGGLIRGAATVLLGSARGDHTVRYWREEIVRGAPRGANDTGGPVRGGGWPEFPR
jgi:hypothetical protein